MTKRAELMTQSADPIVLGHKNSKLNSAKLLLNECPVQRSMMFSVEMNAEQTKEIVISFISLLKILLIYFGNYFFLQSKKHKLTLKIFKVNRVRGNYLRPA